MGTTTSFSCSCNLRRCKQLKQQHGCPLTNASSSFAFAAVSLAATAAAPPQPASPRASSCDAFPLEGTSTTSGGFVHCRLSSQLLALTKVVYSVGARAIPLVDVTKHVQQWADRLHRGQQVLAACLHTANAVAVGAACGRSAADAARDMAMPSHSVMVAIWRAMRQQHVGRGWNATPYVTELRVSPLQIERAQLPIMLTRLPRRTPYPKPIHDGAGITQVLAAGDRCDERACSRAVAGGAVGVAGNAILSMQRRVMVAGNQDLARVRLRTEPPAEVCYLFIAPVLGEVASAD
mmetsp:Transcript_23268/g.38465  ORF Transcript_23268/g.38465 Transcript_23268/m.38465 type:complete len:292 (+) Transcript_23268:82-957(+)